MRDGLFGTVLIISLVVVAALWCVDPDAPWIAR